MSRCRAESAPVLPTHRARPVLIVLLEALFDFSPALGASVRRQPGAWSATGWRVCPSCNGDGSVKRGRHRVECARCRADGGWRIDPYDRGQRADVVSAAPVRAMSMVELDRAVERLICHCGDFWPCRAHPSADPPSLPEPDQLLDAIERQLRHRTDAPAYRAVERALIVMRSVAPFHRAVLVRVHVSQWQTVDQLSVEDRGRYENAFEILGDILGDEFRAPRPVRERALSVIEMEEAAVAAAGGTGRWAGPEARRDRDRAIRRLDELGWSSRAISRRLAVSDRTVRRVLERDERAA